MKLSFSVFDSSGKFSRIEFEVKHIINAGYTGRDQIAVQAHIDELKEEGIPAPGKTPTYFPKFVERITQKHFFEVLDESDHSGEAEYVFLFRGGEVLVGVGSDHTDRKLEGVDIPKAKQIYPNTISQELWRLDDVIEHWDRLILRSWIKEDGKKTLFQEATLDLMLGPPDLIERVRMLLREPDDIEGLIVYSGTVAAIGKLPYSDYFEVEIEDPVLKRKLTQYYTMRPIERWFGGK